MHTPWIISAALLAISCAGSAPRPLQPTAPPVARPSHAQSLSGKTAIVTGASSGLGRAALATEVARAGAQVILVSDERDAFRELSRGLSHAGASGEYMVIDLRKRSHVNQHWMMQVEDVPDNAMFVLPQPPDVLVARMVVTKARQAKNVGTN